MPRCSVGKIFEFFVLSGLGNCPSESGCSAIVSKETKKSNRRLVSFNNNIPDFGLEQDGEETELSRLISPLQQTYQASVLSCYPQKDPYKKLDQQALTTLCFPHGVSLYEKLPDGASGSFHPFIITREDGSKVHAAALTFYEKVLDNEIIAEINELCEEFHRELQKTTVGRLSSYRPLECVYATKCVCFIMSQPFHRASESVLWHVLDVAVKSGDGGTLPLESHLYNLLYEVPLPPPGRSTRLFAGKKSVICYRPGDGELPLLDYPLHTVLSLLGIEQLVVLFKCAMLEQRILIKSSNYSRLMLVCECLSSLLFPFTWAHVYVPILPASMHHFLDAPVPFIMGLYEGEGDREAEEISSCEMCLVDMEKCTVEPPEELPQFPHFNEMAQEIVELCVRYNITLKGHNSTESNSQPGLRGQEDSSLQSGPVSELKSDIAKLGSSSRLAELEAIVKGVGVISSIEGNLKEIFDEKKKKEADDYKQQQTKNKTLQDRNFLKFSECVREVFFGAQLRMFSHYEKFVIYPSQCDMSSWLCSREMMSNFDKEAFLGDQPGIYQPFLCSFLETQMFATFIDNKIVSQWQNPDQGVKVFDLRNNDQVVGSGGEESGHDERQNTIYERLQRTDQIDAMVDKRCSSADYIALAPHILEGINQLSKRVDGVFPELDPQALIMSYTEEEAEEEENQLSTSPLSPSVLSVGDSKGGLPLSAERADLRRQPSIAFDRKTSTVNEAYLQFVNTLLKECKLKTKRMLVGKMGEEAVQLGHTDPTLLGLEENTMIASLCDMLERIWSHGLVHKQHKSPLWAHLQEFSQLTEMSSRNRLVDTFTQKPSSEGGAFTAVLISAGMKLLYDLTAKVSSDEEDDIDTDFYPPPASRSHATDVGNFLPYEADKTLTHRRKGSNPPERPRSLEPLPDNLLNDIKHVQDMKEIKTDIGRARAFIKLSLEKKLLAAHLKELLANHDLLRSLYKRVAFLRCEDEREQALYHLLSLNTADFKCFTNVHTSAEISYRVLVFPGRRFAGGISTTTANVWVSVAGKLRDSDRKWLPRNCYDFTFESKNLGQLSTVRIGHDNSGMAPKWLVDYVIVRNETTGQLCKFACGRWLGRGVDDDSTERILVGETIPYSQAVDAVNDISQNSPKRQKDSPKPSRRPSDIKKSKTQLQQLLSDSVNNLLKYFHKPEKERESVTLLLCGDTGLITRLEMMLSMGFKSSRIFRNNLYIWDYMENIQKFLISHDTEPCRSLVANVTIINNSLQDVGKDGKLQLLLCIAIRDHLLPEWLTYLHYCPITRQMFDDTAFLLDEPQVHFLINLLSMLRSYHISLEPSITQGLDI